MKTQHTPGPWHTNNLYSKVLSEKLEICEVSVNAQNENFDYEQWRANAKLIAAAPELLNLIIQADAWLSMNLNPSPEEILKFRKSLQEAIKKATE